MVEIDDDNALKDAADMKNIEQLEKNRHAPAYQNFGREAARGIA
jgi:hypothetical protein